MIGSNSNLGDWKAENALKLKYAGESVWVAESVMRKDEFPIKYPLRFHFRLLTLPCFFMSLYLSGLIASMYRSTFKCILNKAYIQILQVRKS